MLTQLQYNVQTEGTLILNIHALTNGKQAVIDESFDVDPHHNVEELADILQGESRITRIELQDAGMIKITYKALVNNCFEVHDYASLEETLVSKLPANVLHYLNPSRYCQSDKLYRLAHNLFGHIKNPFEQVAALTGWIYKNVQYMSGYSTSQTSAFDTVTEQMGVCRDFAHLGIALCRALTIPARYFAGYAYQLKPADFHACFEAFLGGRWVLFDATRLVPLNGLIKIATGRDAADTAIANIFGDISLAAMRVSCELEETGFEPLYYHDGEYRGISYL